MPLCRLITNERLNGAVFKLVVESDALAAAEPGQFAMLKCGGGAYLRRPFSFCDICDETGSATFLYRLTGVGTRALSQAVAGDCIDLMGPLGKGFDIVSGRSAIVGGGIGVFPLLLLARRMYEGGTAPDIFAGFQNSGAVVLERELGSYSRKFALVTDDGSVGAKGFVTDAFLQALSGGAYDNVYACGPVPMLKALQGICEERGMRAQFSLEQRMGCGIGACRVCACAVKADGADAAAQNTAPHPGDADAAAQNAAPHPGGAAPNAPFTYARVCSDGPVFASDRLIFD
ncbi:MAG: dihydroorotate dehydrogenase electron transfer subunit [Oscillospiraceae bacterium]|nr:dihydroorotate dehydrogenase electron transfer subunit [Oscillospiraceae bacterium]